MAKVRVVQSKTITSTLSSVLFSFDQDVAIGNTVMVVCVLNNNVSITSLLGFGLSFSSWEVNDADDMRLQTLIGEVTTVLGSDMTITLPSPQSARYFAMELEGLESVPIAAPAGVIMGSTGDAYVASPAAQTLAAMDETEVKFILFAYVLAGYDDFSTPIRPENASYLSHVLLDDQQDTWPVTAMKTKMSVLVGLTVDESLDTSMAWTDAGSDNSAALHLFAFGTTAPKPISVTSVSPADVTELGGTRVSIIGDFESILGDVVRVAVGNGEASDLLCHAGIPGQKNDIIPLNATEIQCFLPQLDPSGGPYAVTVDSKDGVWSGGLFDVVTAYKRDYKTGVFNMRKILPPNYLLGARDLDGLPEV